MENIDRVPSLFSIQERAEYVERMNSCFLRKKITNVSSQDLANLRSGTVNLFLKICLNIMYFFTRSSNISRFLSAQGEAEKITKMYTRASKISLDKIEPQGVDLPTTTVGMIDYKAAKALLRSKKKQEQIEKFEDICSEKTEESDFSFKKSLDRCFKTIASMSGISIKEKEPLAYFRQLLHEVKTMTNDEGKNVLEQLSDLLKQQRDFYHDLSILYHAQTLSSEGSFQLETNRHFLEHVAQRHGLDILFVEDQSQFLQKLTIAIQTVEEKVSRIKQIFRSSVSEIEDELAIFEVSTDRLVQEFSPEILKKPIHVTMVGVEYAGLVKEGGLSEALEGLSVGMKKQHADNHVRLIFPKFSILPQNVCQKLETAPCQDYYDSNGERFSVFTTEIDGVECCFVDHPSFLLTQPKPSIYGPNETEMKTRFAKFSQLASDLLPQLGKTDIIHLHDWHVAGVAIKYKKDHLQDWEEGKTPPIVFTFHNNSRASQGRFFQSVYNYDPIIQGLIQAGIASNNTNAFVDTLQIADSATTVSPTFALESQAIDTGEGVSFAVREAAEKGKLFGVINGSNPKRWDSSSDGQLKQWKEVDTQESLDLTFSHDSPDILEKKQACKAQLTKWVRATFPNNSFDETKPLVTFIGRFDSYQKGLDKLDEAIQATLETGGQFVCMGSLEDPQATALLDKLEKKYEGKEVLFIRDYKDPNGRFHYQQGNSERQGIGSIVRAASDFLFIPSSFEPCGLVQFEGWLFGSLAIGSRKGGLADTIIPPGQGQSTYNGFLFDRNGRDATSCGAVLRMALQSWALCDDAEKRATISRIMRDGKKYSWTEAPYGYSPVEKYRFVYENAKKMAGIRARERRIKKRVNLPALLRRQASQKPTSKANILEERYMSLRKRADVRFADIEKTYFSVPESFRMQLPLPYTQGVRFREYERFGAHHFDDHTHFEVFAPGASTVSVRIVGQETLYPMSKEEDGSWSVDCPDIEVGTGYQYVVNDKIKIDPYGRRTVPSFEIGKPPCSVVESSSPYEWNDEEWITQRVQSAGQSKPMSTYEVYPTAWRKKDGRYLNY